MIVIAFLEQYLVKTAIYKTLQEYYKLIHFMQVMTLLPVFKFYANLLTYRIIFSENIVTRMLTCAPLF